MSVLKGWMTPTSSGDDNYLFLPSASKSFDYTSIVMSDKFISSVALGEE